MGKIVGIWLSENMGCASIEKPKKKHRKGLWSPDEDERLRDYIQKHGHGCWSSVPINAGLQRNGKSCRLRWINYLRPGLKRGAFSLSEEDTIITLHKILGNKWSQIAHHLPGRSDNEIKNYWHSYLKKRVAKMAESDDIEAISNDQIQGLEPSPSDMRRIPLFESVDHIIKPSQNLSLPKVLFADWLSLDQDLGNVFDFKNDNHGPTLIDHDGMETNSNYVDDMLPSTIFKMDCQIPIDYFPGEFDMYT